MAEYDVIVAGGGHNGLTAAAYLAKAGLNVLVCERNDFVGGGVITREVTLPGFKHDIASTAHIFLWSNPLIRNDELGLLSKHGLKYIHPEAGFAIIYPDDSYICLYHDLDKTCNSIARLSEHDAEAYRKFYEWSRPLLDLMLQGFWSPPPPMGTLFSQLDGFEMGKEFIKILNGSVLEVLEDWFEDDRVKVGLMRYAHEMCLAPDSFGTGAMFLILVTHSIAYGHALPEGGSGMLSEALARCLQAEGGEVRTECEVDKIQVAQGKAQGVILTSGEEIKARRAVVADLGVKQLFPGMISGYDLDPGFLFKVKRLKLSTVGGFKVDCALNEPPKYKADAGLAAHAQVQMIVPWLKDYRRMWDAYKYGKPVMKSPYIGCPTCFDPTRAPEGKHVMYLYESQPTNLEGGLQRWDEIKEEVADGVLQILREHTTNVGPENILKRHVTSPLDLQRYNPSFICGDFYHIGHYLSQYLSYRPIPEMGQYRTPVERLYMCGPSTHPGGGVTCGARAAAMVIMEDLGIDFEKVVS